jgi:signal recognition particle subunit SRP54
MFGFGKKKDENSAAEVVKEPKMSAGMKETAMRMMSGEFDMNDMLAQLKQIKKMNNFSGVLKMMPGMSSAVGAMKEKIKDGSIDAQIKILEAMTAEERRDPEKIFANAKTRIAETSGTTVREVEHMIKQHQTMKRQMAMVQKMGGMEAMMEKMKNMPGPKPAGF